MSIPLLVLFCLFITIITTVIVCCLPVLIQWDSSCAIVFFFFFKEKADGKRAHTSSNKQNTRRRLRHVFLSQNGRKKRKSPKGPLHDWQHIVFCVCVCVCALPCKHCVLSSFLFLFVIVSFQSFFFLPFSEARLCGIINNRLRVDQWLIWSCRCTLRSILPKPTRHLS